MDFNESRSIYLQIADYVCDHILSGKWQTGQRVLSVRELAGTLEVNPNTILRSYDFLQSMNIIINKRGIGYFVNENAIHLIKQFRKEHFFNEELPLLFKNMLLLEIELKEIEEAFKTFKNTKQINESI